MWECLEFQNDQMITAPIASILESHDILMRPNMWCEVQAVLKSFPAAVNQKYCLKEALLSLSTGFSVLLGWDRVLFPP